MNAIGEAIFGSFEDYRISKRLVQLCGNFLDAAIISKLYQWTEFNQKARSFEHYRDGRWWTYGTYEFWQETEFPGVPVRSLRRAFNRLEEKGYITVSTHNRKGYDRTHWYTVNVHIIHADLDALVRSE